MPEKVKLTQAKIEELAECIFCCEWNSVDELEKYINDFLSEVEEETETPEPGTSVIRWTRYDGKPETLPENRKRKGQILYFGDGDKRADVGFPSDFFFEVGDQWAYLPTPERGQSKSRGDA